MLLKSDFFQRPTLTVAEELLGQILCREKPSGGSIRAVITEVEAYDGHDDKASHASRGMTPRNEIMFDTGGYWYVYLCYGVHWMLNITTGEKGYPAAVLIRGLDIIQGPGRVTKHLEIDKSLNKKKANPNTQLWIESSPISIPQKAIQRTPRIGVDYAGPEWSKKDYRFVLNT